MDCTRLSHLAPCKYITLKMDPRFHSFCSSSDTIGCKKSSLEFLPTCQAWDRRIYFWSPSLLLWRHCFFCVCKVQYKSSLMDGARITNSSWRPKKYSSLLHIRRETKGFGHRWELQWNEHDWGSLDVHNCKAEAISLSTILAKECRAFLAYMRVQWLICHCLLTGK